MKELTNIEAQLMSARVFQEQIRTAETNMAKSVDEAWKAFGELSAKLKSVACGIVADEEEFFEDGNKDYGKYADDEAFVTELADIQKFSSMTMRMLKYIKVLKGLYSVRKSLASKYDKLCERILYLNRRKQFKDDYKPSIVLKGKVEQSVGVVNRRMEMVLDRFFRCRRKLLESVADMTDGAFCMVDDKAMLRSVFLKNDDRVALERMAERNEKIRRN